MYNYNSSRKQCCTHVINFSFLHVLYVFKLKKWHSCAKYKFLRMVFRVFVGRLVVFLIKKIVFLQKYKILNICMTGTNLLIVAIIIVFVISFIITVLVLYVNTKKIIATNTKLVENQNTLLEQYKILGSELERRMSELEEQKEKIEILKRQHDELAEQLFISHISSLLYIFPMFAHLHTQKGHLICYTLLQLLCQFIMLAFKYFNFLFLLL